MKIHQKIVLCIIMVSAFVLTGCVKKSDFMVGAWNENVFENTWLNMKFEIPEDWIIASQEEINEIIGAGAESLDVEGTSAEQLEVAAKLKSIYAFMVSEPNGGMNVQLMFENLALTIGGTKYTESEYLDEVLDMLLQQDEYQYELIEKNSIDIADKTFESIKLSLYGGALNQVYYSYKKEKFMVSIIVSYTPELEGLATDFINNISTLK